MLDGQRPAARRAGSARRGVKSPLAGQFLGGHPQASGGKRAAPVRVVLVDDEPGVRLLLRRALEAQTGFEVVGEAANGVEALRLVDQLEPDIVVMDAKMPLMDGIAATRLLSQRHPEVAVLALTSDPEARDSLVAAGARASTRKSDLRGFLDALEDLAGKLRRGNA